ncbi:MAG: hypothetical protein K8S23_07785 [Candidatus Cloacimonetes bacterium]|nr:hypothetical protein [Candidatus Cloacimonadota bacterium]
MKNIFILFLLTALTINCVAFIPNLNFDLKTSYNDNILQLSQNDKDNFIDNLKPDKFQIHSLDDVISSLKSEIVFRHKFFYNHTQKIKLSQKYEKFWHNSIKDNYNFRILIQQYLNRQINISFVYTCHPEIYVNHYKSVVDKGVYREFTYAKNVYQSILNLKLISFLSVRYKFEFSQLYFNEYFTEYDAKNVFNEFNIALSPSKNINVNFSYGYRDSDASGEEAYTDHPEITNLKNPSYEQNSYKSELRIKNFVWEKFALTLGFTYQEKYYKSPFESDEYHYARDEFVTVYNFSPKFVVNDFLQVALFGKYNLRKIRSPFDNVIRDKEYNNYQVGIAVDLNFNK